MTRPRLRMLASLAALVTLLCLASVPASAANPVVKTVPWVAANRLIPHDTWSGKTITLKGTADSQGANFSYIWDFGDGSAVATGTVNDRYAIEASHSYTASTGTIFTARLTVTNTSTGETGSNTYLVQIRAKSLTIEVNVAIDEGLWYLHKAQYRSTSVGVDYGTWTNCSSLCNAYSGSPGIDAANVNAFEVNGHLESGDPTNPYTETVRRGMRTLFTELQTVGIPSSQTNPLGTFNPDRNGNTYGVTVSPAFSGREFYQGGMFIDAIVASGTPNAVTTTGAAPSGANPGILGRTYKAIVQDMVDYHLYAQYDSSPYGGGWYYSANGFVDNSISQWCAIGLIAAQREWGADIPQVVKDFNKTWLNYSQQASGVFGYQDSSPLWGPYATTPSGMVQMAMDGIGRGNSKWDHAETFIRDNFANGGTNSQTSLKWYYYGMFSFTKAMLLHDPLGNGIAQPIVMLQSATPGVAPIDWYAAETPAAPTDGIARTLVNTQNAGYWSGHNSNTSETWPFETAWAIIMLNRTLFSAGAPVAVAAATPNPAVAFQTITLDGSASFHQDPTKSIVQWQWDLNNDGVFDASGAQVTTSYPAVGNYPVTLKVTDNGNPAASASTVVTVVISTPPIAPTANAGGPYSFCPAATPWFLDGSKSTNPDDGQHEPSAPPDAITQYAWDLSGNGLFNDAFGVKPDVTAFFQSKGTGNYLIQLKVTDNTANSFPSSGLPNLSSAASAQVFVRGAGDPACGCITNLTAYPKNKLVQLSYTGIAGSDHYNVYRATTNGGPYSKIGVATATQVVYFDTTVTNGITYYYVVRPAALSGAETCQSNQVSAMPRALR